MEQRIITPVVWAFAPEWLAVAEASYLSGLAPPTLHFLIDDGGVDAKQDGDTWLIEKKSLREYLEALLLVAQWPA